MASVVEGEEIATRVPCVYNYNCMILFQEEVGVAEGSEEAAMAASVVEGEEIATRALATGPALSSEYLQFTSLQCTSLH